MHRRSLFLLAGASLAGGAISGAAFGELGLLAVGTQAPAPSIVIGILGLCVAAAEVSVRRFKPLQFDRETPRTWAFGSSTAWAIRTGAMVGSALLTRIGFSVVYFVPLLAFLSRSPKDGAIMFGIYGAARGISSVGVNAALRRAGWQSVSRRLHLGRTPAKYMSAGVSAAVSLWLLL